MAIEQWKKRRRADEGTSGGGGGDSHLETLPSALLIGEILSKLGVESLCSLSCTSSPLYDACSQPLSSFTSLDLSDHGLDERIVSCIVRRCGHGFSGLTLNCLRLGDQAVKHFLGPHLRELHLLKGSLLTPQIIAFISNKCPDLRVLTVEFTDVDLHFTIANLLLLTKLENLCLKSRGSDLVPFLSQVEQLPESLQTLKLRCLFESDALRLVSPPGVAGGSRLIYSLQSLSLVLNVMSDVLVAKITSYLPQLLVLELEDFPPTCPVVSCDLTDSGLQKLGSMRWLKRLSLVRTWHFGGPVSFRRVTDMGMFLLSEGCRDLESVRFSGFSKVSDAGFTSFLHCCPKLKSYEVRSAPHLSDLTFHDMSKAPCSLSELRLSSCNLVTSETVTKLASSSSLEVLHLRGCWGVSDFGFHAILSLNKLTTLDLAGSNITDDGLSTLGKGSCPINRLSLRSCTRVTDEGISMLLHREGSLRGTLSALDLSYLSGISDTAIYEITASATALKELCVRSCVLVSISSIRALLKKGNLDNRVLPIQKLDLYGCVGLSSQLHSLLVKPLFRGFRWLGIGGIGAVNEQCGVLKQFIKERPWLTVCMVGCEIGCHDKWFLHKEFMNCQ
ncbi:hypothetical protein MLD38_040279 [Melastoma candidum]|uniref:Uncharacterized protein n=1 Tax=Melastoma candidum TaxID=119954 RepID=A0ACB9L646_9MYRT|nr:hypothetical protein MLD38_040279 [Melastoma candidum]